MPPDDPLTRLVEDLIAHGVSLVVRGGQPSLHYDDANWRGKEMARSAAPMLSESRDRAVELFQRSLTAPPTLPVQCGECRAWVYSLSLIRGACALDGRRCGFRPT